MGEFVLNSSLGDEDRGKAVKIVKLGGTTTVIPVSDIGSPTGKEQEMGDGTPMDM